MTKYITRSLEWIPLPGLTREKVMEDLVESTSGFSDRGDHVWTVTITNKGPIVFCYGLYAGPYTDPKTKREFNCWHVNRIPESEGPDAYDCPLELMDQAFPTNEAWRAEVRKWHATQPK